MNCPACRQPLALDLGFIIKNPQSVCPKCGLIFNFEMNEQIKSEYLSTLNQIESIKKKYQNIAKFR